MRLRPSPPFRALRAVALSSVAACAALGAPACRAALPAGTLVVADLAGVPTSPAFRMDVRRSRNGAPEAGSTNGPRGSVAGSQDSVVSNGDGSAARAGATGASAAASGVPAPVAGASGATPSRPAAAPPRAATGRAAATRPAQNTDDAAAAIDHLRERLAEKLGATSSGDGKFVMRVSNRGESGENIVSTVPGAATAAGAGARRAAARRAAAAASAASAAEAALHPLQWDYAGPGGPEAWARIQPGAEKCATGTRQSPIDIRDGIAVDLEPIRFDYRPGAFSVLDDGHGVQVHVEPGNAISVGGRRYELVRLDFHRPAEERIEGRPFDMDVHLVHQDAEGHQAVVAVLLERGAPQPVVQAVWNNLPLEKHEEAKGVVPLDPSRLLPDDKRYYTYMGSLTTPPCSEGVLWMVMKQAVPVSPEQIAIFAHLYPMNARPIQQAQGRLIKESN
jgi:carbonic anhydrase